MARRTVNIHLRGLLSSWIPTSVSAHEDEIDYGDRGVTITEGHVEKFIPWSNVACTDTDWCKCPDCKKQMESG